MALPNHGALHGQLDLSKLTPEQMSAALPVLSTAELDLVLAANRDEFFDRPATRMGWWMPPASETEVLSGRDQSSGGTWLGLSSAGRLALLTNVRDP